MSSCIALVADTLPDEIQKTAALPLNDFRNTPILLAPLLHRIGYDAEHILHLL